LQECPVVGEIAEIALDADQPVRMELPVGANGSAGGPTAPGDIDLPNLIEQSGWRAGLSVSGGAALDPAATSGKDVFLIYGQRGLT